MNDSKHLENPIDQIRMFTADKKSRREKHVGKKGIIINPSWCNNLDKSITEQKGMDFNMKHMHLQNIFILFVLTDKVVFVFTDSYFMSTGPVLGGLVSQDVARNTTQLLDQLLQGYDSRLRPGFGGKFSSHTVTHNITLHGLRIIVELYGSIWQSKIY